MCRKINIKGTSSSMREQLFTKHQHDIVDLDENGYKFLIDFYFFRSRDRKRIDIVITSQMPKTKHFLINYSPISVCAWHFI